MRKILWLCNVCPSNIALRTGEEATVFGGWLTGLSELIIAREDVRLAVCYPQYDTCDTKHASFEHVETYAFPGYKVKGTSKQVIFERILQDVKPDVVHIHGTEFPHSMEMAFACRELGISNRACVSIQGLVSVYAHHYFEGLPSEALRCLSVCDLKQRDSLHFQRRRFRKMGRWEEKTIKACQTIIGRTTWDRDCSLAINKRAEYFHCNEVLRPEFYRGDAWSYEGCIRESVFVSQWEPAYKGFHQVIRALPSIAERHPNVCVRVGGNGNPFEGERSKTGYARWLRKEMARLGVTDRIAFLGALDAGEMKSEYLRANAFLSPAAIENSPNSLGEAMIVGTPCVASFVGGVPDLIHDHNEGWLYPYGTPYALAAAVANALDAGGGASQRAAKAREHAMKTHDRESALAEILGVYDALAARR